jgi:hypothetical protein
LRRDSGDCVRVALRVLIVGYRDACAIFFCERALAGSCGCGANWRLCSFGKPDRRSLCSMTCERLCVHSVFAFQPAAACNLDCCAKRLCDEMTRLAMLRSIPVLSLVLDLQHRGPPANASIRSESTATCGPGSAVRTSLHILIVKAQPRRVMIFVHHAALLRNEPPAEWSSQHEESVALRASSPGVRGAQIAAR